jgi:hypothetical protein
VRGHSGGSTINGVATGLRNTGDATAWWAALFWDALTRGGVFAGSRIRVGLLALPLCGAAPTFFAAAKKVGKESSSFKPAVTRSLAMLASGPWHSPKCRLQRPNRAWLAHGLTS